MLGRFGIVAAMRKLGRSAAFVGFLPENAVLQVVWAVCPSVRGALSRYFSCAQRSALWAARPLAVGSPLVLLVRGSLLLSFRWQRLAWPKSLHSRLGANRN